MVSFEQDISIPNGNNKRTGNENENEENWQKNSNDHLRIRLNLFKCSVCRRQNLYTGLCLTFEHMNSHSFRIERSNLCPDGLSE